jgi:hypothetical protein
VPTILAKEQINFLAPKKQGKGKKGAIFFLILRV